MPKTLRTVSYAVFSSVLFITGCAGIQPLHQQSLNHVLATPLYDLNLLQAPISPVLTAAKAHPYTVPFDTSCTALATHIDALNLELGGDIDVPDTVFDISAPELHNHINVEDSLVTGITNEVGRTITGFIPYRRWIRALSGAARHSKRIDTAIAAGTLRRAFLKGVYAFQHCPALPAYIPAPPPINTAPTQAPTDDIYRF